MKGKIQKNVLATLPVIETGTRLIRISICRMNVGLIDLVKCTLIRMMRLAILRINRF